jgi:pyruvate dehydrogenase E2 component (dihydrolipoamide acetyltransferase)
MATKVHMEALSPTMSEGQVVQWLKAEGDAVSSGEVLAEIETDKATMELVARGDGVLRKILVSEGATAPVGSVIAVIAGEDEDISALVEEAGSGEAGEEAAGEVAEAGEEAVDEAREEEKGEDKGEAADEAPPAASADGGAGRARSSPLARRLAEEAGLDVTSIRGSGPGGRVVKRDVEEAREAAPAGASASEVGAPEWMGGVPATEYEDLPLSQMRKTIARRLAESIGPVPHFFLTVDVDMGRILEARQRMNALLEASGDKVSVNDILLKGIAAALRRHPECNSAWQGDAIRRYHVVHLGVAVAVEDGLITPVVRHADRKGVAEIAREVREMAGRARDKRLKPEEYTGATFSVSNLGMLGIHEFTAVINPPEAGILAIGRAEEQPVVVDGQVTVRPRMRMTMSCDHRVIDGATGARFLQTLTAILEEPAAMLL